MAEGDEVDVVGIILYSMFFLLVCWRVKPFFGRHEGLSQTDRLKLGFHACLLGSALLELAHYAIALAKHRSVLSEFACHLVALWLSLVAFSLVIVLWSNTLTPPRRAASSTALLGVGEKLGRCCSFRLSGTTKFVVAIDAVVAVTTVVVLWTGVVPAYSRPYLILVVAHSVTLFLLASWLVLYGVRLQRRVMGHPRWEPLDRRQRLKILCRINGVLVVCAVCFLIRVAVLSSALFVRSRHRAEEMNRLLFELLSKWVSGLVPGVALLHIMCKTKKSGADKSAQHMRMNTVADDQPLRQPLLPSRGGVGSLNASVLDRQEEGRAGSKSPTTTFRQGGMGRGDGSGGGGESGDARGAGNGQQAAHDSFVYHVVRSQRERTETTI
ncbi:unnamed protein product [Sphacelaria rigidula]